MNFKFKFAYVNASPALFLGHLTSFLVAPFFFLFATGLADNFSV